eukprot:gene7204-8010_t
MYDTSIIPEVYMRKQVEMQHPPKCGELNNELAAQQHTYISAEYIEAQTNHNSDMQAANRCRLEMAGTNHHFPSQIQDVPSSITNSQPKIINHAGSVCRVSNNHPSHYQASTWNSTVYPARSGLHSPSEHLSPSCAYQNSISTPYMLPVQRGYYHQSHRNYMANQWFQEFSQAKSTRSALLPGYRQLAAFSVGKFMVAFCRRISAVFPARFTYDVEQCVEFYGGAEKPRSHGTCTLQNF